MEIGGLWPQRLTPPSKASGLQEQQLWLVTGVTSLGPPGTLGSTRQGLHLRGKTWKCSKVLGPRN